ncbi:PKD domain-containing protein [Pseudoflavitalea sp. X16]|uniref:PKD domain-containing protein n=1 Tax=Paraflavitalea devenefica TaxID=2716334 RepID=UPI00141EA95A|nr:PKD domain-containing protein [Paraflavitalea devenefica]NII26543.1 PKD domain-containing protein [Paraflavitalea devenefica]
MKPTSLLFRLCILIVLLAIGKDARTQLVAAFSSNPVAGCAPVLVNFKDASSGNPDQWEWDLGNGTISYFQHPSVTYFNPGTYTVKLTVRKNGRSATITKTQYITVYALPVIDFSYSATTGCYPLKVDFTDKSAPGSGTLSSHLWDFGDGIVDRSVNPGHTYQASGDYNISLQVTNSFGCKAGATRPNAIRIHTGVKAGFTVGTRSCQSPSNVPFANTSTGTGSLVYKWDFGDGSQSTALDPVHTYTSSGNYIVTLTVSNSGGCQDVIQQTVEVGKNKGDFTAPAISCVGQDIQISNTSNPTPLSVAWDFGDGTTGTDPSPAHAYGAPGNYTIKQVTAFSNCQDIKIQAIKIIPAPTVDFSAAEKVSCKVPFTTTFTSFAPDAVAWKWEFGDGETSTLENPSHTYKVQGVFNVSLTITNGAGCEVTATKNSYIEIKKPDVRIMNALSKDCVPFTFKPVLNIISITPIVKYEWDFGDGSTGTGLDPVHTYTQKGTYTVSVTYTTQDGCKETISRKDLVKVGNKVKVDFDANPKDACASTPIKFTDLSKGNPPADNPIEEWTWQFGDGGGSNLQHPTYVHSDTGSMWVGLTVYSNGCPSWATKTNFLHIKPPIAKFKPAMSCADPYRRDFINESIIDPSLNPLTYLWDFGDGQQASTTNASHVYNRPGMYDVTLTVVNGGCSYATSSRVFIVDNTVDLQASDNAVCIGGSVKFDFTLSNTDNIIRYYLYSDYSATSYDKKYTITETYTRPGTYAVYAYVVDTNHCAKSLIKTVQVIDIKAALQVAAVACINKPVNITNISTGDVGFPVTNSVIDFGDGSPVEVNQAVWSHVYSKAGDYTVTLKVSNSKGCPGSTSTVIHVTDPKADFSSPASTSCVGKVVSFVASGGQQFTYEWDFGDGQTVAGPTPVHQYANEGTYSVVLRYKDQYGCTGSVQKTDFVKIGNPVAGFTISDDQSTCPPLVVTFADRSINAESISWDFGDGNTSTNVNPVHFYTYPGEYWPKMIVTSKGGCIDVLQDKKITIKGPTGTFNYGNVDGCAPVSVEFTGVTNDAVKFIWDFNDGAIATTTVPKVDYTYSRPGSYLPRMILEDVQGCQVPIIGPDVIDVYGLVANFSMDKTIVCDRGFVQFTDQSVSNDVITNYFWKFGDGSTGSGQQFSKEYTAPGDYMVQLEVTTQHNCKHTVDATVPIQVIPAPKPNISSATEACVPADILFQGQLQIPNPYPLTWAWSFNNGQTANVQNPSPVSYEKDGRYQVSLAVTNSYNCTGSTSQLVTIHPLPALDAGEDVVICEHTSHLLKASGAVKYTWSSVGSMSCVNCSNTMVHPATSTRYYVEGESSYGCKTTDSVYVMVQHPFTIDVRKGDTICVGEKFQLEATGADRYSWSPATGLDKTTVRNPLAQPNVTTLYQVIGSDNYNCFTDTAYVPVTVYPYPKVEMEAGKTVVVGTSVTLQPKISPDVKQIQWTPGTWLSCIDCAAPVASPKQTIPYRVLVTNEGGCIAEKVIKLFVVCNGTNVYLPNTFSPNNDGVNDVFYPQSKGVSFIRSFRIFNRWGELVFEQFSFQGNDRSKGWNGKQKNQPAVYDVFVYVMEVTCDNGEILYLKGDVTIIR